MKKKIKLTYKGRTRIHSLRNLLIISGLTALLAGAAVVLLQTVSVSVLGFESTVYRKTIEIEPLAHLDIRVANIPLQIINHAEDNIRIEYVNETDLSVTHTSVDSYIIEQDVDFAFSLFARDQLQYHMKILLPHKIYHDITISSASGNVTVSDVLTNALTISTRSGKIVLDNVQSALRANTDSGDMQLHLAGLPANAVLETNSGDIELTLPVETPVRLEFSTESGEFSSDFFERAFSHYPKGLFLQSGYQPKKMHIITASGKVNLRAEHGTAIR